MANSFSEPRRAVIKSSLAIGGMAVTAGLPFWSQITLAADEQLVPFTDVPEGFRAPPVAPGAMHFLDTRNIKNFYTPNDKFYIVQHYNQPVIAERDYRLQVTGLVHRPIELTLADIKRLPKIKIDAGFECGGNRGAGIFNGLIGNAQWGGVSLRSILRDVGVSQAGTEVVFYGADKGVETVRDASVEQTFGRSMGFNDATSSDAILAYEMNGETLPLYHGAPLRLIVPGWYGVANVKWLEQIHVQDRRYMGRFMARDYVTLSKRTIGGVERWEERSVTRMRLKSSVIRVSRSNVGYSITGFVLNDGTPIESVEIKINDGQWRQAIIDPQSSKYSWKLFNLAWDDAAPGEHTIVSRVTDINGQVQATAEQLPEKQTRWENYAQFPRTVRIT